MIRKTYPDITEIDALFLSKSLLSWLTVIGNTALKRVEGAKKSGSEAWESRAIILATSVIARMFLNNHETETELLGALTDWLLTLESLNVTAL